MEASLAKFKTGAGSFQSVIAELVAAVDVERKQLEESRRRLEEERQAWEQERKVGRKGASSRTWLGCPSRFPRPARTRLSPRPPPHSPRHLRCHPPQLLLPKPFTHAPHKQPQPHPYPSPYTSFPSQPPPKSALTALITPTARPGGAVRL